jgi:Putative serine esterase (DUF676)
MIEPTKRKTLLLDISRIQTLTSITLRHARMKTTVNLLRLKRGFFVNCQTLRWKLIIPVAVMASLIMVNLGILIGHPSPASADSVSNGTTLLLVHGYTDTCFGAFDSTALPADAGPNAITTRQYLEQQGWGAANIDAVGYYSPSTQYTITYDDQSTKQTDDGIQGTGATSTCNSNLYSFSLSNASTNQCPGSNLGYEATPIRTLGCELAWYIYTTYTSQGRPVAILAHSMGGLIVRDALGETGKSGYPSKLDVRRVVTVATPHGGLTGEYLAEGQSRVPSQEVNDMDAASPFMTMLAGIQKPTPPGSSSTFWGLIGAAVPCNTVGTHTQQVSCVAESNGGSGNWADGDGIVQAESMMAMNADVKVLYGAADEISGPLSTSQTFTADTTTEYSHEANICGTFVLNIFGCMASPYYLNDGTPNSQTVKVWICTQNCTSNIADMTANGNGTAPHSLAEIVALLPPPFHLGTSQSTFVSPSMATFNNQLYVGWAGTDTHLNLMSSSNGTSFGNVITMSDTSGQGPSLAGFNSSLVIAWSGTDSAHHIYVVSYNGSSFVNHTALADSTTFAPAIAAFNGKLYLAWVGTDASHHLNVESSTDGVNFGNKVTLSATAFAAPALNGFNGSLNLAWTGTDSSHHLNIVASTNGTTFPSATVLSDTSLSAPALTHNNGFLDLAWTGINNSRLNIESSVLATTIDGSNKVTLGDTSSVGPALASFDGQTWLTWSGTDSPPHLYLAAEY